MVMVLSFVDAGKVGDYRIGRRLTLARAAPYNNQAGTGPPEPLPSSGRFPVLHQPVKPG
jgi:hypothetical protein